MNEPILERESPTQYPAPALCLLECLIMLARQIFASEVFQRATNDQAGNLQENLAKREQEAEEEKKRRTNEETVQILQQQIAEGNELVRTLCCGVIHTSTIVISVVYANAVDAVNNIADALIDFATSFVNEQDQRTVKDTAEHLRSFANSESFSKLPLDVAYDLAAKSQKMKSTRTSQEQIFDGSQVLDMCLSINSAFETIRTHQDRVTQQQAGEQISSLVQTIYLLSTLGMSAFGLPSAIREPYESSDRPYDPRF